jgi:NitT/TauT family transport system substrate-binding protein
MDFLFYGNHAPFALALDKGFYKDEGLNASIIPGQGSSSTIPAVASGQVDFGYASPLTLVQLKAKDPSLDVVVVAQIMQHAPWIAAYIKGRGITTPADLAGKKWGGTPGGPDAEFYKGYMRLKGYELGEFAAIDETYPALLAGQIDVAPAPVTSFGSLDLAARKAGKEAAYFSLTEDAPNLDHYNWALIASRKMITEKPDLVRKVVAATLRGWDEAIKNPTEAVSSMKVLDPNSDPDSVTPQLDVSLKLAVSPDTCQHGLGYSNPSVWERTVQLAVTYLAIKETPPDSASLFTNDFLPEKPLVPATC